MCIAVTCQAMVDRHDDDIAEERHLSSVKTRSGAGSGGVSAAMKRDQHRALRSIIDAGRPDVEDQTILAHAARLLVPHNHHPVFRTQVGWDLRTDLAVS